MIKNTNLLYRMGMLIAKMDWVKSNLEIFL